MARAEFQGPTDAKAQKTYAAAATGKHERAELIDIYEKADKQDGHRCAACQYKLAEIAMEVGDYDRARKLAMQLEGFATTPEDQAVAQTLHGRSALRLGIAHNKSAQLSEADQAFQKAISLDGPHARAAVLADGIALANLKQDDAARARFTQYLKGAGPNDVTAVRVARYQQHPELARERMAPPFTLTTLSGEQLSLDNLQGKVVLLDFWATWCGPCREALPHMQHIVKQFAGQPLVVLSVSLDKDEAKWKEFVGKNHMDWQQYCDGSFDGQLARGFGVTAIPATFTIDADGVVQDQHVGDADIERKLKKLLAQAAARPAAASSQVASN